MILLPLELRILLDVLEESIVFFFINFLIICSTCFKLQLL